MIGHNQLGRFRTYNTTLTLLIPINSLTQAQAQQMLNLTFPHRIKLYLNSAPISTFVTIESLYDLLAMSVLTNDRKYTSGL